MLHFTHKSFFGLEKASSMKYKTLYYVIKYNLRILAVIYRHIIRTADIWNRLGVTDV